MRTLGIDFGTRRVGLSYADEVGVAVPLAAAVEATQEERLEHIGEEIERRRIELLVVGYPYNMNGSVGFKAREVDVFITELERRFQLPVQRIDERLSSYAADGSYRRRPGRSRRDPKAVQQERRSGERDSRAAAVILQDYLDQQLPLMEPDLAEDEFD